MFFLVLLLLNVIVFRLPCGFGSPVGSAPCGFGSPVGSAPLWVWLPCGLGSPVGSAPLWVRLPCWFGSPVGSAPLWVRLPCGLGSPVGSNNLICLYKSTIFTYIYRSVQNSINYKLESQLNIYTVYYSFCWRCNKNKFGLFQTKLKSRIISKHDISICSQECILSKNVF